jgi:hypothetical protein
LKILDIPRISDNKMFSMRTKNTGTPVFLEDETDRLYAVILLLRILSSKTTFNGSKSVENSAGCISNDVNPMKAVKVFRYNSIELHFKTPKMESAEIVNKHRWIMFYFINTMHAF